MYDVFNILFQVLDDGRLTDGQGRTVDFRNTVIVMTSNLGSDVIQDMTMAGSEYPKIRDAVLNVVSGHFRPEFINRVDELVVFEPLDREQVRAIAGIQIAILNSRLAERELRLEISDEAMARLADVGFDPVYGARPLKRAIQQRFENPLAQRLLKGEFSPGQVINATVDGDDIVFGVARLQ